MVQNGVLRNQPALLELIDVRKSYDSNIAVDGVSLCLEEGVLLALLGPNGAGKSTLINIISGLTSPDSGTVVRDLGAMPISAFPGIGFAPQQTGIYPLLTVRQNLEFFGAFSGLSRKDLSRRIDEIASALGLTHLLKRQGQRMSGGEQRRLHTAIALIAAPPLLLLDEPTVGADIEGRNDLLELVKSCSSRGSTVVYSTHYLGEVETLNGDIAILDRGKLIIHDKLDVVKKVAGGCILEIRTSRKCPEIPDTMLRRAMVDAVDSSDGEWLRLIVNDPSHSIAELVRWLAGEDILIADIKIIEPSVEAAFLALTKRRYEGGSADG
jgi:ABC-2 type transport system ATP-binding protein